MKMFPVGCLVRSVNTCVFWDCELAISKLIELVVIWSRVIVTAVYFSPDLGRTKKDDIYVDYNQRIKMVLTKLNVFTFLCRGLFPIAILPQC